MSLELLRKKIKQHGIHGLYYFSLIENAESIIQNGILPKNDIERRGVVPSSFANQEVQERRHYKKFNIKGISANSSLNYISLHSLVPLYFTPKTPTLKRVSELRDNIFFIKVNPEILCSPEIEFCFTNGNAANRDTNTFTELNDLDALPWKVIHSKYWNNFEDGKRKRNSEVLIYPKVSNNYFLKIAVNSEKNKESIAKIINDSSINNLNVEVNFEYFF